MDLDDDFPANEFKGFKTDGVYLSIYGERYAKDHFNFIIKDIAGKKTELADIGTLKADIPVANVDFGEYTKEGLPFAVKGQTYKVFSSDFVSLYGNEKAETAVYYGYGSNFEYRVELSGGSFVTDSEGVYTIVYRITDRYGLVSENLVHIICKSASPAIVFETGEIPPELKSGYVGKNINIYDDIIAYGGSGNLRLSVAVADSDGNQYSVINGKFFPDKEGVYSVVYTAEDYVGQQKTMSYEISVNTGEEVIFDELKGLRNFFIADAINTVPALTYMDYTTSPAAAGIATVEFWQNDEIISTGLTVEPKAGSAVTVVYSAVSSKGVPSSFSKEVTVVDTGLKGIIEPWKYFSTDDKTISRNGNDYLELFAAGGGLFSAQFINELVASSFNFRFNIDGSANSADSITIQITDSVEKNQSITLTIFSSAQGVTASLNGAATKLLNGGMIFGGSRIDFIIELQQSTIKITENAFRLETYTDGSPFVGFTSGKITLGLHTAQTGSTAETCIIIKNINGQPHANVNAIVT